jgi:hypothetical protein
LVDLDVEDVDGTTGRKTVGVTKVRQLSVRKFEDCPWCGSDNRGFRKWTKEPIGNPKETNRFRRQAIVLGTVKLYQVYCEACGCAAPWSGEKDEAAKNWNRFASGEKK